MHLGISDRIFHRWELSISQENRSDSYHQLLLILSSEYIKGLVEAMDDCIERQRGKNVRFVVIKYRLRKADAWEGGLGAFIESYAREQSVVSWFWPVLDMGLFVV